jgi:hypothetical protein
VASLLTCWRKPGESGNLFGLTVSGQLRGWLGECCGGGDAQDEAARRLQTDMSSGILLRRPLRAASAPSERLVAEVAEAERELQAEAQRGGGSEGRRESSETAPSLVPILEATWGTGSPSSSPAKLAQRASTLPSAQLLQAVFDSKEDIRREAAAAAAAANDGAVGAGGGGTFRRSTSAASDGAEGTTASTTAPSTRTSIGTGTRGILPRHIQDLQPGVPVAEQLGLSVRPYPTSSSPAPTHKSHAPKHTPPLLPLFLHLCDIVKA